MKSLIIGGIFGFICSIVLPEIGITTDSLDYWAIIVSGAVAIGLIS